MAKPRPARAAQPAANPATILTLLQLRCAASYWQHASAAAGRPGIDDDLIQELLRQARDADCSRAQLDDAEYYGKACFLNGRTPSGIDYSCEQFATTLAEHLGLNRQS